MVARLRGKRFTPATFWARVKRGRGCWLWQGATTSNGRDVRGVVERAGKRWKAHRVAWELTNGAIPPGLHVCHTCDRGLCCRPSHLFLGTHADNMRDSYAKGRCALVAYNANPGHPSRPRGARHWTARRRSNRKSW